MMTDSTIPTDLETVAGGEIDVEDVTVELVVLDMAGTTVKDDGIVEQAFRLAAERTGVVDGDEALEAALRHVRETMGQSKIEVFRAIAEDEAAAVAANAAFEEAYVELVERDGVQAVDGAEEVLRELRGAGVSVALTTGFSRATADVILDALGWRDLVDASITPAEAGRGRPYPDLVLTALLRTGATSVDSVIVVGDTESDIRSGLNAGAGLVIGVLTGAHDEEALAVAGADDVLDSVAELPALLGLR